MSSSYPRHVTGAGSAYYSYRPICRIIEKGVRKTGRENASIPKDFQQGYNTHESSLAERSAYSATSSYSAVSSSLVRSRALARCSRARSEAATRATTTAYEAASSAARSRREVSRAASEVAISSSARARSQTPLRSARAVSEIRHLRSGRSPSLSRFLVTSEAAKQLESSSSATQARKVTTIDEDIASSEVSVANANDALRFQRARSEAITRFARSMSRSPSRYTRAESEALCTLARARRDAASRYVRARSQTPQREESVSRTCCSRARSSSTSSRYLVRSESTKNESSGLTGGTLYERLGGRHPYRLPVEDEYVAPHPESYWPVNRRHFDLVSSYDLMMDYLGITRAGLRNISESK